MVEPYALSLKEDSLYLKDAERIYSKQTLHSYTNKANSPYLLYATMDGTAFICLEFNDAKTLIRVHHCMDSPVCISYNVYSIDGKQRNDFDTVFSFKVAIQPHQNAVLLHGVRTHIQRTTESNCLIKRFVQTRGFCYYHAVLHGLLIPNNMKRVCCKKLLDYMALISSGQTPYSLETFMNINICENFDKTTTVLEYADDEPRLLENTRYYIMKFFYQYLFHFEEIYERVQLSKHYINYVKDAEKLNYVPTRPIHIHPVDVLVRHEKPTYKGSMTELPTGGFPYDVVKIIFQSILGLHLLDLKFLQPNTETPDIYVYRGGCKREDIDGYKLTPPPMPNNYTLEMGLISIYVYNINAPTITLGHAIVGVVCNGEKYLIDSISSSYDYVPCDWTSMKSLIEYPFIKNRIHRKGIKQFSSTNAFGVCKIDIEIFYLKKETVPFINTCNTIKKTYIHPRILNAIQASSLDATIKASLENTMKPFSSIAAASGGNKKRIKK